MIKQIFKRDSIQTVPWKNGGGITREIAASRSEEGFWRLSIADVEADGAFSNFPGLHRILTVVAGERIVLSSPENKIDAVNGTPVLFAGDASISCSLPGGPIQDFNLIFDPKFWDGQVKVGSVDEVSKQHWNDADISAIYCLDGAFFEKSVGEISSTWGAILRPGEVNLEQVQTCQLLCVDLRLRYSSGS